MWCVVHLLFVYSLLSVEIFFLSFNSKIKVASHDKRKVAIGLCILAQQYSSQSQLLPPSGCAARQETPL